MSIKSEELLKKENISIEESSKEFNNIFEKVENLKTTIEEEMSKIDKLYDKVNTEVTNSFELKHKKLKIEENNLKEKLQFEVTKVKEKLENFLTEINKEIKINQKMIKGIKILEKEENKNMLKSFSYISKINKNIKEMNNLFKELIKNLKISFNKEHCNIEYEDYYFNGIQIPKEIVINKIKDNSLEINWKINDVKINNIDNKNIRFRVELRKDNKNEKFVQIYEGHNNYCFIYNLDFNTNYEVRICCVFYNLVGFWSEIQKVTIYFNDSKIF